MGYSLSVTESKAYRTLLGVLKKQRGGVTVADMTAKTALPLQKIRELIPRAADEYNARLAVTESGEILYSFPRGFTSRYRGFIPSIRRFAEKAGGAVKVFLSMTFKVWIMAMLVSYFVLFILLALAAMLFFMAASSASNKNGRRNSGGPGGTLVVSRMLNFIMHFWFYSSLMNASRSYGYRQRIKSDDERPLYKKVFSFVFGDGDPNADWKRRENMDLISCLQSRSGVISLPEFMALTGLDSQSADREILAFCSRYGGMPEASEDGTVVYRFDSLLLSSQKKEHQNGAFGGNLKKPWKFSSNKKKTDRAFAFVNGVNLAFGLYFLYFILKLPVLISGTALSGSYLFIFVYNLLSHIKINPAPFISAALGIVPVLFSLFFWLVPFVRRAGLKRKNAAIDAENRRKTDFAAIWKNPLAVTTEGGGGHSSASIREMGAYSVPDVALNEAGKTVYSFTGIEEEKKALEKYRAGIDTEKSRLGSIVFDSGE